MASLKVEICLKKKKPTPSTNIPLLSLKVGTKKTHLRKSLFYNTNL